MLLLDGLSGTVSWVPFILLCMHLGCIMRDAQPIQLWLESSLSCTDAAVVFSGLAAMNKLLPSYFLLMSSQHMLMAQNWALALACPASAHAAVHPCMLGACYRAKLITLLHLHQGRHRLTGSQKLKKFQRSQRRASGDIPQLWWQICGFLSAILRGLTVSGLPFRRAP